MRKKSYTEYGQAALIVLLMSAVVLTIGLATAARTVTDIKISSQLEESDRALAAAEAGVELGLKSGSGGSWYDTGDASNYVAKADYTASDIGDKNYTFGAVEKGETKTVWFVDHDATGNPQISGSRYNGSLTITWQPASASLEFVILDKDKKIKRSYDSGGTKDFSTGGDWILLRVKPLERKTQISVEPGSGFKAQGKKIVSTGSTVSGVTRKVEVTRWYPSLPGIFDYVIYSGGDLKK